MAKKYSDEEKRLFERFEQETGKKAVWKGKITQKFLEWDIQPEFPEEAEIKEENDEIEEEEIYIEGEEEFEKSQENEDVDIIDITNEAEITQIDMKEAIKEVIEQEKKVIKEAIVKEKEVIKKKKMELTTQDKIMLTLQELNENEPEIIITTKLVRDIIKRAHLTTLTNLKKLVEKGLVIGTREGAGNWVWSLSEKGKTFQVEIPT